MFVMCMFRNTQEGCICCLERVSRLYHAILRVNQLLGVVLFKGFRVPRSYQQAALGTGDIVYRLLLSNQEPPAYH